MNDSMLLNEINYKMSVYKDCSLNELLFVGSIVFITESLALSFLTRILIGYFSIGVVLTFLSFFHITKFVLLRLQKIKYGKPHGYYKHLLIKKLISYGLCQQYVTRTGKWSVRRLFD